MLLNPAEENKLDGVIADVFSRFTALSKELTLEKPRARKITFLRLATSFRDPARMLHVEPQNEEAPYSF